MTDRIIEELLIVAKQNDGILRPNDVVKFAGYKKSELHKCFEWDDKKAGHEYRLEQARRLIRRRITIIESNGDEYLVKTFTSLESDRAVGDSYRLTVDILSDENRRVELLQQAKKELEIWRKKYQTLKELAPIFEAMDKLEEPELVMA